MRSCALLGQNNNILSMVNSLWNSINCVETATDIPATLSYSCMGSGGGGGMAAVTDYFIYCFGLGFFHHDFIIVCLVYI